MRTDWIVAAALACLMGIVLSVSARETQRPASTDAYPHGALSCLQGDGGPGLRLRLRPSRRCEGNAYPHLEIDVRELPITVHKSIIIGPENWAFRCPSLKESCEQSTSGEIVFNHLDKAGKDDRTDGSYELRFRDGTSEKGQFTVDCEEPCG